MSMQIFDAIRKIVGSCARKHELAKHAEQWLRAHGKSKSLAIEQLRKDWLYLRWSIQSALVAKTMTRDLPYAIAKNYWKQKSSPSNVDLLFAEEEAL